LIRKRGPIEFVDENRDFGSLVYEILAHLRKEVKTLNNN
jgi:hypothetical protein